ncbi:FmdB family zinc ribbon protein [Aquimonas sp.]|jgi:putative FmdB family regulatory protein|uniref:FmdB family zinc ribbon protein n=1 Tax=Aquimonas sp. TaxID=1872588 RepID=UPI0037BEAD10
MPIYGFECSACGHSFERLQKLADADPTVCPACGAEQVRRQISAPSFRLAGGGWYETDFKKDGDKKRNLAEGGGANAGGGEGAAPAKPAETSSPAAAPASTPTPGSSSTSS